MAASNDLNTDIDLTKFVKWCGEFPRKFEVGDVQGKPRVRKAAYLWLEKEVHTFEYLIDMQYQLITAGHLSEAQVKGVLNCIRASVQRANASVASANEDGGNASVTFNMSLEPVLANGTYTFVYEDDGSGNPDYVTIRIRDSFRENEGEQIAEYLCGPNNENDFMGFAFVQGTDVSMWKRFRDNGRLLEVLTFLLDMDNLDDARKEYALLSGRCARCNRKLTVPASIHNGLGPECASKI